MRVIPRKRTTKVVVAVLLVGAVATSGVYATSEGWFSSIGADWFGSDKAHAEPEPSLPDATTEVARQTLVSTETVSGTLGYGDPRPMNATGQGVLTRIAAEDSIVRRGESPYRIDNRPVPLLYGKLPLYRPLEAGMDDGPDVAQLERNLKALGYSEQDYEPDEEFNWYTEDLIEAWQEDLGLEETGRIEPGQVTIASGPIRVESHQAIPGDQAGSGKPVLDYTETDQVVTVDLEVEDRRLAQEGETVTVELPDGGRVRGTIDSVSTNAESAPDEESAPGDQATEVTVEVVIELDRSSSKKDDGKKDDQDNELSGDAGGSGNRKLDQGPVVVEFIGEERKDALTVPIMALLALSEGGYGVELVEGKSTEVVPVDLGMFAEGRVEISGEGISEGVEVGVPDL